MSTLYIFFIFSRSRVQPSSACSTCYCQICGEDSATNTCYSCSSSMYSGGSVLERKSSIKSISRYIADNFFAHFFREIKFHENKNLIFRQMNFTKKKFIFSVNSILNFRIGDRTLALIDTDSESSLESFGSIDSPKTAWKNANRTTVSVKNNNI